MALAQTSPQQAVEAALLPDGLQIAVFAENIDSPRSLAVRADGVVAVGSRSSRSIYLLTDTDNDGVADLRNEISSFSAPNGVVWHGDNLIIAELTKVHYVQDPVAALQNGPDIASEVVIDGLVNNSHHGFRFIDIGPDGSFYMALGTPCNICIPPDPELTATIRKYDMQTWEGITYAYGLRNSVGFDWHPETGELWATDSGRDWLGDDLPADELNRLDKPGQHYGFPYCHQGDLPDPEYGGDRPCSDFVPTAYNFGAHVSSLGLHFVRGDAVVDRTTALVALHGSWNRSEPVGYAVGMLRFSDAGDEVVDYAPFITGWLTEGGWFTDGKPLARPVDIAELPDGSLLISDDGNGAIYRVSRK